jgi:DeoR family fructose operon transcriptional repressor
MLAEERYESILEVLAQRRTVTVQELSAQLGASEATVRRDLTALGGSGRLRKVRGGAALASPLTAVTRDDLVSDRSGRNYAAKLVIARAAAALIKPDDFVYIDAGSTTALLVEQITASGASFVTNAMSHALALARKGCPVFLLGGEVKPSTEALVGAAALKNLARYNFTLGFFGTNGITLKNGYSTPDPAEAMVKAQAMKQCKEAWVLADPSKFDVICPVSFGRFRDARIITTKLAAAEYMKEENIMEADKQ